MATFTITKDPDAVLDYAIDWEPWLAGGTIATSAWSFTGPDTALVIDSDSNSTTVGTVVLSAGTAGRTYTVTNHITTAGGYADDRSISVTMVER